MKTLVVKHETPNVDVRISNMVLDIAKKECLFVLRTKQPNKKKWNEQEVRAFMTKEMIDFFTIFSDDKIKIVADNEKGYEFVKTGTKSTAFQRLLKYRDIDFKPGILNELVFECPNDSPDRALNPFRIYMGQDSNIISLVNIPSKKRIESINPETGEITVKYAQKYGQLKSGAYVKAFFKKENYRRLVIRREVEVEVFQEESK